MRTPCPVRVDAPPWRKAGHCRHQDKLPERSDGQEGVAAATATRGAPGADAPGPSDQPIRSAPPMYGRSASGTVIEPSAFW
ncbi:hypothetical protein NB709_001573 [Xanthomonas sacchari]|nr:hypothetical protein [Xanthomonas sacchari]